MEIEDEEIATCEDYEVERDELAILGEFEVEAEYDLAKYLT